MSTTRTTQHAQVEISGKVVASTERPIVLSETHLPDRYYFPPEDVDFSLLEATDHHTTCPYKGVASYWSFRDPEVPPNLAWAYPTPIADVPDIKDHVAFYGPATTLTVDGVEVPS